MSEFINFAPLFDGFLEVQRVTVLEENLDAQKKGFKYKTPKIIDSEGDNISVEIRNLPIYLEYTFFSTQSTIEFSFIITKIDKSEMSDDIRSVTIYLLDDSGISNPRQVNFEFIIDYVPDQVNLNSYLFIIPEDCSPMDRITSVNFICPTSSILLNDICNDIVIPSRI